MGAMSVQSQAIEADYWDMEFHLSGVEGAELVCNVDRSRLDIVGLTSIHRSGSGTSLLKRGWTFFQFGAVLNKRQ